jgi:UDP-glucuronate decarboxylase
MPNHLKKKVLATGGAGFIGSHQGNQTRTFCHVDKLVDGLIRPMESPDTLTGPINLGSHKVLAMTRSAFKQRRPDITLAGEALSWQLRTSLEQGLAPTVAYFRDLLDK